MPRPCHIVRLWAEVAGVAVGFPGRTVLIGLGGVALDGVSVGEVAVLASEDGFFVPEDGADVSVLRAEVARVVEHRGAEVSRFRFEISH